jgi:hypothetical protein
VSSGGVDFGLERRGGVREQAVGTFRSGWVGLFVGSCSFGGFLDGIEEEIVSKSFSCSLTWLGSFTMYSGNLCSWKIDRRAIGDQHIWTIHIAMHICISPPRRTLPCDRERERESRHSLQAISLEKQILINDINPSKSTRKHHPPAFPPTLAASLLDPSIHPLFHPLILCPTQLHSVDGRRYERPLYPEARCLFPRSPEQEVDRGGGQRE